MRDAVSAIVSRAKLLLAVLLTVHSGAVYGIGDNIVNIRQLQATGRRLLEQRSVYRDVAFTMEGPASMETGAPGQWRLCTGRTSCAMTTSPRETAGNHARGKQRVGEGSTTGTQTDTCVV
jgi:hypothetical protein